MDCFKYLRSKVAADGGCERNVVHRMNDGYRAWGSAEKCPEQQRTGDIGQEVSMWK